MPSLARMEAVADSLAREQIAAGIPGMTVAVAHQGRTLLVRGYGRADVARGENAGSETIYQIGSVTKQFSAALVLRLVQQGRISLDEPIAKYLPDYPLQGQPVTVRHLLNHTSGMGGFPALTGETRERIRAGLSYREIVGAFAGQPFESRPGERFRYNGLAYYLLGEIIARVTGTSYAASLERELLRPLGLRNTYDCDSKEAGPGRALGYETRERASVATPGFSMRTFGAGGALCSTAGDLVRWTHLLHAGRVVPSAYLRQMIAPTVLSGGDTIRYGYGVYLGELEGRPKVHHGGVMPGFASYLAHYPGEGLTVAVLANSAAGREPAEQLEDALARAAFGVEVRDLPLTAAEILRYEGSYTLQAGTRTLAVRVFSENGHLHVQPAGQRAGRLRYQGRSTFVHADDATTRLVFAADGDRAQTVTLHQRGRAVTATRTP